MCEQGELGPAPWARLQCPPLSPPSTGVAWTHTRAPQGCGRVRAISHTVQLAPSFKGGDATSIFRGADTPASSRLVWSSIFRSQLAHPWGERRTPGLDSLGGRQRRRRQTLFLGSARQWIRAELPASEEACGRQPVCVNRESEQPSPGPGQSPRLHISHCLPLRGQARQGDQRPAPAF